MTKRFIIVVCVFLNFATVYAQEPAPPQGVSYEGVVTRVFEDGAVQLDGKKLHLMGVHIPWRWWWGPPRDCFSVESGTFLEKEVLNKQVIYSFDPNYPKKRHGKRRVYLNIDGRDINAEIVSRGFAFADRSRKYIQKDHYNLLEDTTRTGMLGLWHTCPVECYEHNPCKARNW